MAMAAEKLMFETHRLPPPGIRSIARELNLAAKRVKRAWDAFKGPEVPESRA